MAKKDKFTQVINIQPYHSPCGDLILGSIDSKLCLCDWANGKNRNRALKRLQKVFQADLIENTTEIIQKATHQLDEYFSGKRMEFDIALLFVGTEFQRQAWQKLLEIPYGATISYSEQAQRLDAPKAVRAVANANGANAISIFAPCHRVIGGNSSLTGYGGGLDAKKYLLDLEQSAATPFVSKY
ncbi:MAG: methylated-DNA--[protein]-cysteine S-methyltransferase [Dysgonamonadaceae bacterium]|jgi:methylated-DNA-[protein]-cysteine S-methyltransferase|nr:methylated-DNA--[protein]-cysteine S-methyltransferase [Dysgonamonadaceae bacterium]